MNSTTVSTTYMKELITVLRWFQSWFQEIQEEATKRQNKQAWQQFIPRKTYQDLLVTLFKLPRNKCFTKKYVSGR